MEDHRETKTARKGKDGEDTGEGSGGRARNDEDKTWNVMKKPDNVSDPRLESSPGHMQTSGSTPPPGRPVDPKFGAAPPTTPPGAELSEGKSYFWILRPRRAVGP